MHELLSLDGIQSSLAGQAFHSRCVIGIIHHVILAQYLT